MEWQQLITDIYKRILQELEHALDGLTVDDLNQQPHPNCNSIGWLTWHLTRAQDRVGGCCGSLGGGITLDQRQLVRQV